jgi:hypothetical protein
VERKPRQGRARPRATIERDPSGLLWQRANGCFIEVAEGFVVEEEGKKAKSFRVGLHLIEGRIPLARLAMTADQALDLARSLIAYSASVEHLCEHHPDGSREHCTWQPKQPTEGDVERLVDESLGPLERGLQRARQIASEVASVLQAMQTVALEEGLLTPRDAAVEMDGEKEETITRRLDRLMQLVSPEAKRVLAEVLYQTGDEGMAEFFGRTVHRPSSGTAH